MPMMNRTKDNNTDNFDLSTLEQKCFLLFCIIVDIMWYANKMRCKMVNVALVYRHNVCLKPERIATSIAKI